MAYAQGAVLVLPFPYSDRLTEKRRPALVVSSQDLERKHGILWVAMITSDRGDRRPGDIPIQRLERTGLSAPSLIRPAKIATTEPSRVLRQAGKVTPAQLEQALDAIRAFL